MTNDCMLSVDDLIAYLQAINQPGEQPAKAEPKMAPPETMDFSDAPAVVACQLLDWEGIIRRGGQSDLTRFEAINAIVGMALSKVSDMDTARALALAKCQQIIEGFEEKRDVFETAFKTFSANDKERARYVTQIEGGTEPEPVSEERSAQLVDVLKRHATSRWAVPGAEVPPRQFLVDGLVQGGVPQMLAADGGVGKTMLALDLALKITSYTGGSAPTWLGRQLTPSCLGGSVIMLTAEDDRDELNRRMLALDPEQKYRQHNRLILVSLIDAGGAFPFVQYAQQGRGMEPNPRWTKFSEALHHFKQERDVKLVIIDTLNATLHGDENSSSVVQEWFRVVGGSVCRETLVNGEVRKPAMLVTHHIRKAGQEDRVTCPEEMRQAVRGSGALLNSVRSAIGIWKDEGIGRAQGAVIKANNPEMYTKVMYLERNDTGLLERVCKNRPERGPNTISVFELDAWIELAVKQKAEARDPLPKNTTSIEQNKEVLPPRMREASKAQFQAAMRELLGSGRVVTAMHGKHKVLDVPGGPYDAGLAIADEVTPFEVAPDGIHYTEDYIYDPRTGRITSKFDFVNQPEDFLNG